MTVRDRLAALLPRIELRRWPWRIDVRPGSTTDQLVVVTEHVLDRDTGEPAQLGGMLYDAPPPETATDAELVLWVRDQLRKHVLHELDEAFLVDGVRVCDPHGGDLYFEDEPSMPRDLK